MIYDWPSVAGLCTVPVVDHSFEVASWIMTRSPWERVGRLVARLSNSARVDLSARAFVLCAACRSTSICWKGRVGSFVCWRFPNSNIAGEYPSALGTFHQA